MILADNETKVDLLNNEAIAKTIINLLTERPDRPVTIGVHGDWGAGKSSVLEMIDAALDGRNDVLCLKFNGWRFQGFEDAKIALIEGIVTGLIEKRSLATKAGDAVKAVLRKIDWLKVARHGGGLAITAMTGIPMPDQINAVVGMLKGFASDPSKLANKENYDKAIEGVEGLLKEGESKHVPKEIDDFRKTETRIYVTLLLIGRSLGEDDAVYSKLISAARDVLKKPWMATGLDAATVQKALGDKFADAGNALSDASRSRCGPAYAVPASQPDVPSSATTSRTARTSRARR